MSRTTRKQKAREGESELRYRCSDWCMLVRGECATGMRRAGQATRPHACMSAGALWVPCGTHQALSNADRPQMGQAKVPVQEGKAL